MNDRMLKQTYGSRELSYEPEYVWQDDAACAFMDPLIFEPILIGERRAEGLSDRKRLEVNSKNFRTARQACKACPVIETCKSEATEEDHKWTFRAGLPPTRYSGRPVGRPLKNKPPLNAAQIDFNQRLKAAGGDHSLLVCQYGHEGAYENKNNGRWACTECRRKSVRKSRAKNAMINV